MWDDEAGWNAYAGQGNDSGGDTNWNAYMGEPTQSWGDWTDYVGGGDVGGSTGWNYQPPAPSAGQSFGGWQGDQNYNFTPDPSSRVYPMQANTSQDIADRFMQQSGGNAQGALGLATGWRQGQFANNPELRDASHDLWTRAAIEQNPVLGRLAAPILSPGYSAAKYGAQYLNQLNPYWGSTIDSWMKGLGMEPLVNASSPSGSEIWSGIRPIFRR